MRTLSPDTPFCSHTQAINVSPLAFGHSLILPYLSESRPQYITFREISVGMKLIASGANPARRLLFNSLGSFSSVNHLHFHILSMEGITPDAVTPIERVDVREEWGFENSLHPGVMLYTLDTSETGWGCEAFLLEASAYVPVDIIAGAADDIVSLLYALHTPFHLLVVPCRKLNLTRMCVYIIPRQNQAVQERTPGLRQAAFEVVGVQVCLGPTQWANTTWAEFMGRLRDTVSLQPSQLAAIAAKTGWVARSEPVPPRNRWLTPLLVALGATALVALALRDSRSAR